VATIRQRLKHAEAALQRVEAFVAAGGDLKSQAATPVWLEFLSAFADVAKQFGYDIAKPVKKADLVKTDLDFQS
jgi:hypothetical protein